MPRNLLINGDGRWDLPRGGWNTAALTRVASGTPAPFAGALSAFEGTGIDVLHRPEQWIPIDPRETYRVVTWVRRISGTTGTALIGLDVATDTLSSIAPWQVFAPDPGVSGDGLLAVLATGVSQGQTTIRLDRDAIAAGFPTGGGADYIALNASLTWRDLPNVQSFRYVSIGGVGNTDLTLAAPIPAGVTASPGTGVRWHQDGPAFEYGVLTLATASVPTIWTRYERVFHGTFLPWVAAGPSGAGEWAFRPGTTRIRPIAITGSGATADVTMQYIFQIERLSTMFPASVDLPFGPRDLQAIAQRGLTESLDGQVTVTDFNGGRSDHWEMALTSLPLMPEEHARWRAWIAEVGIGGTVVIGDPADRTVVPNPLSAVIRTSRDVSPTNSPMVLAGSHSIPISIEPLLTGELLPAGAYCEIGDGWHQLTQPLRDEDATTRFRVLHIWPPTRVDLPSGTPVRFVDPRMQATLLEVTGTDLGDTHVGVLGLAVRERV